MWEAIGFFVLGLVLLALGGDSIVKGASGLAQRFGASPFVAGLVVVAFGTSLPELAVNARAVVTGSQALALGNAVGSNVVNVGLTLGAAALTAPLLIRWRALAPLLLCLVIATLAVMAAGWDGVLSRTEGVLLLVAFVVVIALVFRRSRVEQPELQDTMAAFARTSTDLAQNVIRTLVAIALLYFGAKWVVQGAPVIGLALGMAPLVTGLLVVAIGAALPEVAAAVMAARRGHGDIVAGHVIGSSVFNLLVVLGGMATVRDVPVPASFVRFELPAAFVFALMLYPMLRGDLRISRREGGVLLVAFAAWVAFEIVLTH